jgi:predicted alpha/beta-fold hydrolase
MVASPSTAAMQFSATWNTQNSPLKDSWLDTIVHCLFKKMNKSLLRVAMPSTQSTPKTNQDAMQVHRQVISLLGCRDTSLEIKTPDDALLRGSLICPKESQLSDPIVIFAQPNATLACQGIFYRTMQQIIKSNKRCNFLVFDYRSAGRSEGELTRIKDLVVDLDSVYNFAIERLNVPAKDVHMMGFSIGGAVLAQVKALHPENTGNCVIDRSFSNIIDVATSLIPIRIISCIARLILNMLGWSWLDSGDAFKKINTPSLILHHPQDHIIQEECQLHRALDPSQKNITTIDLSTLQSSATSHFHNTPLQDFSLGRSQVTEVIAQFLLKKRRCPSF